MWIPKQTLAEPWRGQGHLIGNVRIQVAWITPAWSLAPRWRALSAVCQNQRIVLEWSFKNSCSNQSAKWSKPGKWTRKLLTQVFMVPRVIVPMVSGRLRAIGNAPIAAVWTAEIWSLEAKPVAPGVVLPDQRWGLWRLQAGHRCHKWPKSHKWPRARPYSIFLCPWPWRRSLDSSHWSPSTWPLRPVWWQTWTADLEIGSVPTASVWTTNAWSSQRMTPVHNVAQPSQAEVERIHRTGSAPIPSVRTTETLSLPNMRCAPVVGKAKMPAFDRGPEAPRWWDDRWCTELSDYQCRSVQRWRVATVVK